MPINFTRDSPDPNAAMGKEHVPQPPLPGDERTRVEDLHHLNVLDTETEDRYDDITQLCTSLFKMPISVVSLVDSQRLWFKSVHGLPVNSVARNGSFCAWTVLPKVPEVLVVPNAEADARFRNSALVTGDAALRFYAGAPLVLSNGSRAGTLCVADHRPHPEFSIAQCQLLANMGELVVRELERAQAQELRKGWNRTRRMSKLRRNLQAFREGVMLVDTAEAGWRILYSNWMCHDLLGTDADVLQPGKLFWDIFHVPGLSGDGACKRWRAAAAAGEPFSFSASCFSRCGQKQWVTVQAVAGATPRQDPNVAPVQVSFELQAGKLEREVYFLQLQEQSSSDESVVGQMLKASIGCSWEAGMLACHHTCPLPGVRLGALLSKSDDVRLHRAHRGGKLVAVKMVESMELGEDVQAAMTAITSLPQHPTLHAFYRVLGAVRAPPKEAVKKQAGVLDWDCVPCWLHQCGETAQGCSAGAGALCASSLGAEPDSWLVWMVLQHFSLGSLADLMQQQHDDAPAAAVLDAHALHIALSTTQALMQLHDVGTVHGNLHCRNVLLSEGSPVAPPLVAVADAGLFRLLDPPHEEGSEEPQDSEAGSRDGSSLGGEQYGAAEYLSPQLLAAGVGATRVREDDVFALGVVLQALGASRVAGEAGARCENCPAEALRLPQAAMQIALACQAEEPAARPTVAEVAALLSDVAAARMAA